MFTSEELGLIAYLNDNARSETNRNMLSLAEDRAARALDLFLSGSSGANGSEEDQLIASLRDRKIGNEALASTTARIRDYLEKGIDIVTFWDPKYPGNLRLTPDPPLLLYVQGRSFPGRDHVAIVGTGYPSRRGLELAYEYGARIARKGRTVVSGLTRGIDAQALEGALGADGGPIAVLGTPLTDIYPQESKALASEIAASGALVSELTEEAYIHPGRSLQRNRVIAGMAGSLVIIESSGAGAISGLVEVSLRQGRRAYIVDQGSFEDPDHEAGFKAARGLGAVPISSADDMISQEARQGRLF